MYDLHIHSLLSDGVLLPSEIARRYEDKGYKIIAITDHCDYSNIKNNIKAILEFCKHWPKKSKITIFPGVELTHLPLEHFKPLARYAKKAGIKIVVAHGESPVEPVVRGTNRAALMSDIDILAHPGEISREDALLAKKRGVFLELTSRSGHAQGNQSVAKLAKETGAKLIINNDAHSPKDIIEVKELRKVAKHCGLSESETENLYLGVRKFLGKLIH